MDSPTITIRAWPSAAHERWPKVKWIFMIRHGESAWNVAEKDPVREMRQLVTKMDHFLSAKGREQASELALKIESWLNATARQSDTSFSTASEDTKMHQDFLEAEAIFASPLARALQTALLCLRTHPTAQNDGLKLRSELREVKSYWGRDTQSKSRHHEIVERSFENFKKNGLDIDALQEIQVDTGNTRHEWWDTGLEHPESLNTRTREILTQVKLSPHSKVIMVTHSILVKQLIISHAFRDGSVQPPLVQQLMKTKLPNCGVLAMRANFNLDVDCCIDKVALLFDTQLPHEGPGDRTFMNTPSSAFSSPSVSAQLGHPLGSSPFASAPLSTSASELQLRVMGTDPALSGVSGGGRDSMFEEPRTGGSTNLLRPPASAQS